MTAVVHAAENASPQDAGSFDEDLARLEQTVRDLETGRLGLEDALKRFEDGVALTERLRARLEVAEGRVDALLDDNTTEDIETG